MKRDDFRKALQRAKDADPLDRTYYVEVPEIHKDAKIYIFPLMHHERDELVALMADIEQWAIIILCSKDEDGNRLFVPSDIEFLDTLGYDFRRRLFDPAFELSGLGKDYKIKV